MHKDFNAYVVSQVAEGYGAAVFELLETVDKLNQSLQWLKTSKGVEHCHHLRLAPGHLLCCGCSRQSMRDALLLTGAVAIDDCGCWLCLLAVGGASTGSAGAPALTDSDKIREQVRLDVLWLIDAAADVTGDTVSGVLEWLPILGAVRDRVTSSSAPAVDEPTQPPTDMPNE